MLNTFPVERAAANSLLHYGAVGWDISESRSCAHTDSQKKLNSKYERNFTGGQYICHLAKKVLNPNLTPQQLSLHLR